MHGQVVPPALPVARLPWDPMQPVGVCFGEPFIGVWPACCVVLAVMAYFPHKSSVSGSV